MLENVKRENNGYRVLVVDDCSELLQLSQLWLTECGFSVVAVDNGYEALHAFKHSNFDLVISDISMPGIDGNLLAQYIRTLNNEIPIAALTSAPHSVERAYFDLVLEKPYKLEALERVLLALLENTETVAAAEYVSAEFNDRDPRSCPLTDR